MRFLAQPSRCLSDAALGAVALRTAARLARRGRADRAFVACIATMGAAASWGAVHHAVITPDTGASRRSWAAIATTLSVGIGLLLAGSARATLPRVQARRVTPLGAVGPALYVALATAGRRDMGTMVAAQSLSMTGIVGLWLAAAARHQPGALIGLAAVATSALAGSVRALPAAELERVRLDRDSAYHLAQIPGVIVLALAAESVAPPGNASTA